MEKVEIGKKYYFNNREVVVLRMENEQFAFISANLKISHEITGSNFCESCNVGGMGKHKCFDAQEVIDCFMEDIGEHDLFWVDIRYLKEEPFEYRPYINVQKEIKEMAEHKSGLELEIKNIQNNLEELKKDKMELENKITNDLNNIKEKLEKEIQDSEIIIESRKKGSREFTAEEVEYLVHNEEVYTEEGEDRRWSRTNTVVVKKDGRFYELYYEHGLTENQENSYETQTAPEVELQENKQIIKKWVKKEVD